MLRTLSLDGDGQADLKGDEFFNQLQINHKTALWVFGDDSVSFLSLMPPPILLDMDKRGQQSSSSARKIN